MARNYKKEAEWERNNFDQIKFRVPKGFRDKFNAYLKLHGMTVTEWFNYAFGLNLVPPDKMTGCSMVGDYDTGSSEFADTGSSEFVDTGSSVVVPSVVMSGKRRSISPTDEMVQDWLRMYNSGMSYKAIAATTSGYDSSTIRKRIKKVISACNM